MDNNGTRLVDGTAQVTRSLIVPGMESPVIITRHTLKVSCCLIATWMAFSLLTSGKYETSFLCALQEIRDCEGVLATFCLAT